MKKLLYILLFVPLTMLGQDNYSLSFDGVDDMVSCGSTIDISSSFSIAAWVYALPDMANYTIASKREMHQNGGDYYNGFHLTLENDELGSGDDGLRFVLHNNSQGDSNKAIAPLNFNQWNYVVGVFDSGSSIKLYINGELVDNVPTSLTSIGALSSTADFLIGAAGNYPTFPVSNYINGNLEDVSLWSHPLSIDEIQSYMSSCINGNELGLIGHWNFNEGFGDTIYDISINGNHGIRNGPNYSNDTPGNNCYGCKNPDAINYDENIIEEDEQLCIYSQDYVHGLWNEVDDGAIEFSDYQEQATTSVSSLQQALSTWNTTIDLSAGWNMFGYGCPSSINVSEGLSNHTESIIITKDNNGNVYMPEFGFNGIGDFTPGFGYQIKLTDTIEGFSLCDWYVNDIPEDNIVSLQEENASLQVFVDSVNAPTIYQVGDYAKGGIVFYIDETGQHGLVATLDDLEGNDPYDWGYGGFEWGCVDLDVNNATGWDIGTGRQNTLGIVNAMCTTINNGNSAALQSIITESNGYYDWYLPSIEELVEMYDMIGNGSLLGNIGNFYIGNGDTNSGCGYWSSTQYSYTHSRALYFNVGDIYESQKQSTNRVRPIRSF